MDMKEFVCDRIKKLKNPRVFMDRTPKFMLHYILLSMCKCYDGKDALHDVQFTIIGDDKTVSVHKANRLYLSKRSPVFNAMFTGQLREALVSAENLLNIDIIDINSDVFSTFLSCIYDPCEVLSLPNMTINDAEFILDLLYAIKKYICEDILKILIYKMHNDMTLGNAFFYYSQRNFYSEIDEERCWIVLTSDTYSFIRGQVFLDMPAEDLIKYLKNININASELDLLKAIIKWAQNKIEDNSSDDQHQQVKQILGVDMVNTIRYPKEYEGKFFYLIESYDLPYKEAKKKDTLVNKGSMESCFIQFLHIADAKYERTLMFAIYKWIPNKIIIQCDCVLFVAHGECTIKGFLFATTYVSAKLNVQVFLKNNKIIDESDAISSIEKPQDKAYAIYRFATPFNIDSTTEFSIHIKTSLILNHKVKAFKRYDPIDFDSISPIWDKKNHAIWGLVTTF